MQFNQNITSIIRANNFGTVVEWYGFALYGFLAPYLGLLFFPNNDPAVTIQLGLFAVTIGHCVRPLSGVFFGYIGDVFGRQNAIKIALWMTITAVGTMCIIPTYDTIGGWATVLIILARVVQGFSAGGEFLSTIVFLTESAPSNRKNFLAANASFSVSFGISLAALTMLILSFVFTQQEMVEWGWRIPMYTTFIGLIIAIVYKHKINKKISWDAIKKQRGDSMSFLQALNAHKMALVYICGLVISIPFFFHMFIFFIPLYLIAHNIAQNTTYFITGLFLFLMAILSKPCGKLSDRIGWKRFTSIACCGLGVSNVIFMSSIHYMIHENTWLSFILFIVAYTFAILFYTAFYTCLAMVFLHLLPSSIRLTGGATMYSITATIVATTLPFLAFYISDHYGIIYFGLLSVMPCVIYLCTLHCADTKQMLIYN